MVVDFEGALSPFYRPAHGLALMSVMATGVWALRNGLFRVLCPVSRAAMVLLTAVAAVWALAAYSVDELLSPLLLGSTGPFVWFTVVFVLAGADRRVWMFIDRPIRILAYTTAALACWAVIHSSGSAYLAGYSKLTGYGLLLMWLGGWTLLSATALQGWRLVFRTVPYLVFLMTAVYSQARSWTVMALLLGMTFVILRGRAGGWAPSGIRNVVIVFALSLIAGWVAGFTVLRGAVEGLSRRMTDDTRSLQYVDFFSVVPVSDLLLGRGPKGTWYWYGMGEYQYFDNGLLWTLFIGGLPTLVPYGLIVVWPGVRALRAQPRGQDAAAVCLVLFWGLALTGISTYTLPSLTLSSYLTSLCAGRCHLILAERRAAAARWRQTPRYWNSGGAAAKDRNNGCEYPNVRRAIGRSRA